MSYLHISNLHRAQEILLFRECYAMEKVDGTSAHVRWVDGELGFFSGGAKHEQFLTLFNQEKLRADFENLGRSKVVVFGEAHGGKQQGQSWRYGNQLRFVAFEVKVDETWLSVPSAEWIVKALGLEFVHYVKCSTDLDVLNAERDAPSEQARRNGVEGDKPREGIVLRPLIEAKINNGGRIIAKYKRDDERETRTPRTVIDSTKLKIISDAERIAEEWVTDKRLEHVVDQLQLRDEALGMEHTQRVVDLMIADVVREGEGEIVDSREARKAIGHATVKLLKKHITSRFEKSLLINNLA
jgi:RNA ligase.